MTVLQIALFALVLGRCNDKPMGVQSHNKFVTSAVSWLLALSLLLPMLLLVLPSPVSAEELALYRDLQKSRCLEQGLPMPDEHVICDECVLCAQTVQPRVTEVYDPYSVFAPMVQTAKVSFVFESLSRAELSAINRPDPGRGPPA